MNRWIMPTQARAWRNLFLRWTVIPFLCLAGVKYYLTEMPGDSYSGTLPPFSETEQLLSTFLRQHVEKLAQDIGRRNLLTQPQALHRAEKYIQQTFEKLGALVHIHSFQVGKKIANNLWVILPGTSPDILVIGAHYDSISASPGANDNATGVAALLELARLWVNFRPVNTIYLVAFINEEPPFFADEQMGSHHFAQMLKKKQSRVLGMLSLETIGYYSEQSESQFYPSPWLKLIYPDRGNFIAFVGNLASRSWVHQCIQAFRQHTYFPSEGITAPNNLWGVDLSDHRSFWAQGWSALMVTDTAPFRYPYYHTPQDTPDKIDYDRTARVVLGLSKAIEELANTRVEK